MADPAQAKKLQFLAAMERVLPDWNPIGPLVQADVETAGFRKIVGWNNFWGIKAPSKWTGKTVRLLTTEYAKDMKSLIRLVNQYGDSIERATWDQKKELATLKVLADFADWWREDAAVEWYGSLIKRRYQDSHVHRQDPNPIKFFEGLVSGDWKWATNPLYVSILIDRWEKKYKGVQL